MSLGLNLAAPEAAIDSSTPRHKSAGLAFALSLIVPGSGQIYCGKRFRGITTLVLFAVGFYGVVAEWPSVTKGSQIWGGALFLAIPLYVFALLDAYFTALEMNAGIDAQVDVQNPRVAATLNFFTNGFGYFYLGQRGKGFTVFLVLFFLSQAIYRSAGGLVALAIPTLMAIDGYRTAKAQIRGALGEQIYEASRIAMRRSSRLPVAVPLAVASFFLLALVGILGMGTLMTKFSPIDQSGAIFREQADPKSYENAKYRVRMLIPAIWEFDRSGKEFIASAKTYDGGCHVALLGQASLPLRTLKNESKIFADDLLSKNKDFKLVIDRPARLGSLEGHEIQFTVLVGDTDVIRSYVLARKNLALYALMITVASPLRTQCDAQTGWIRENTQIGSM